MCVIAVKPQGLKLPEEAILKNMWDKNSDGAGFMYATENKVYIEKGFMTYEEFTNALNGLKERFTDDLEQLPLVLHFRITTHGGTSRGNTHPFPISDNVEHLKALDLTAPVGVAHNGVIHTVKATTDLSDTQMYVKTILYPLSKLSSTFMDEYETLIDATIGASKLAFLEGNGTITMIGTFTELNGIHYSNTYWKPYTPPAKTYASRSSYYWDSKNWLDYTDDDDDDTKNTLPKYSGSAYPTKCKAPDNFKIGTLYKLNEKGMKRYSGPSYDMYRRALSFKYTAPSYMDSRGYFDMDAGTYNVSVSIDYDCLTPMEKEIHKPDNIGGAKNKETANIKQTGNREAYLKCTIDNLEMTKIPKGYKLGLRRELFDTFGKFKEDGVQLVVDKAEVFMTDYNEILFRQKDGTLLLLSCVDTVLTDDNKVVSGMDEMKGTKYMYKSSETVYILEEEA